MNVCGRCLCAVAGEKALQSTVEGTGAGVYVDSHPWIVAAEMLNEAANAGERMAVVLASGEPAKFSRWAFVKAIDVRELHRGLWQTRCAFGALQPVNPIFQALDSVFLAPPEEQLHRERVEPVRVRRQPLDAALIHPYAVCETPVFILAQSLERTGQPKDAAAGGGS